MKIPKEISGKNKLRDMDICALYIQGKKPEEIIAFRKLKLTPRRVEQIIYTNSHFVNPRVAWPKTKRIMRLQRLADKFEGTLGKSQSELNVLEQLRKEIEGEKPLVDLSKHNHVTYVWNTDHERNENAEDSDSVQPTELPEGNPLLPNPIQNGSHRTQGREILNGHQRDHQESH